MNPRQLIGMTAGARKRAARIEAACIEFADDDDTPMWAFRLVRHPEHATPDDRRRALHAFAEYLPESARLRWAYVGARAACRLGERLRPCSVCPKCRPDLRWENGCGDMSIEHGEDCGRDFDLPCRCRGRVRLREYFCDGSGVLLATATSAS